MADNYAFISREARRCPCPANSVCRCNSHVHPYNQPIYPPPTALPYRPPNMPVAPGHSSHHHRHGPLHPPNYPPPPSRHPPHHYPSHPRPSHYPKNTGYHWVDTNSRGATPSTALRGGVDVDGSEIFIGRAFFDGDWLPAKIVPQRREAYVAHGGREHCVDRYEVLCEQRFDWIPCSGSNIPPDAVEGGRTADGEPLYIGRVYHEGSHTVGKVHPSHGVCYIPFGGEEISYDNYEILTLRC